MMRILIAPNAFKNSLSADEVAESVKSGLEQSNLNAVYECFPIGDGGDGTGTLLNARLGAKKITCYVQDPLGRTIQSFIGFHSQTRTAIVEMAAASGLRLLKAGERNPMRCTSFGTGELLRIALDQNPKKIILAIGGSATVDGGIGILQALGIRFLDHEGKDLRDLPERLVELQTIDLTNADVRMRNCELIVLCDVSNVMLGPDGAARIFGPQKGASPTGVVKLEDGLRQLALVTKQLLQKDIGALKYGGAAGGTGAMLHAVFNAKLVNGIDHFIELTGFDRSLATADLVITGEGRIDEQTVHGKGPWGIASRAKAKNLPVIALGGQVPAKPGEQLSEAFDVIISIQHGPISVEESIGQARHNLIRTAFAIGNLLAIGSHQ
jgi:glycerate 2-kinase